MSGKKKKQLPTRKEPPKKLLVELAQANEMVKYFNSKGQRDTIWHDIQARLQAAVDKYEQPEEPIIVEELET